MLAVTLRTYKRRWSLNTCLAWVNVHKGKKLRVPVWRGLPQLHLPSAEGSSPPPKLHRTPLPKSLAGVGGWAGWSGCQSPEEEGDDYKDAVSKVRACESLFSVLFFTSGHSGLQRQVWPFLPSRFYIIFQRADLFAWQFIFSN